MGSRVVRLGTDGVRRRMFAARRDLNHMPGRRVATYADTASSGKTLMNRCGTGQSGTVCGGDPTGRCGGKAASGAALLAFCVVLQRSAMGRRQTPPTTHCVTL